MRHLEIGAFIVLIFREVASSGIQWMATKDRGLHNRHQKIHTSRILQRICKHARFR